MTTTNCANHPGTETTLRCGKCEKPICPKCVVFTDVGTRCRECARITRLPTFDVRPAFLTKGIAAGLISGIGSALVLGFVLANTRAPVFGLFVGIILAAIGYVVGESISLATNRKRGPALQAVAVASYAVAVAAFLFLVDWRFVVGLYGLVGLVVGLAVAVGRVR
jgi:hypothetical protein